MRMLVAFALAKYWQCEVRHATNGVEGLAEARRARPHLMVVDINMPEMDGLELIQELRSDEGLADVPVVVLTTEGSQEDVRRGMQAGATAYLVKPFQPQKLHAIVEQIAIGPVA